jgi:hypothetical protein
MTQLPHARCVGCDAEVSGPYCASCGEATTHHDYSLKHLVEELFEAFAHVDGRVFSTFRMLITRPGQLASDYLIGRRKSQMGPVQLFVVCNVIYFLLQPFTLFATFTSSLEIQRTARPWSSVARSMTDARVAARGTSFAKYGREFNETAHLQGKTLIILNVPIFALGVWVLHRRARRFYGEHLVFAFYTYSFVVLWIGVSTLVTSKVFDLGTALHWWPRDGNLLEAAATPVIFLPLFPYVWLGLRRLYARSWVITTVNTVLLLGWMAATLTIYRFILFFTSYYAT